MARTPPTSNRRLHLARDNNRNDRAGARTGRGFRLKERGETPGEMLLVA